MIGETFSTKSSANFKTFLPVSFIFSTSSLDTFFSENWIGFVLVLGISKLRKYQFWKLTVTWSVMVGDKS